MRTQVIEEPLVGQPWLEYYPAAGGPLEQALLESFPFTIGRNPSVDLQIDSSRVSREHAVIRRQGDRYLVEDLGSTNGTFLNGHRVEKAPLQDGDILLVADTELSFFSGRRGRGRAAVTQPIDGVALPGHGVQGPVELIRSVRRLHELLAFRAVAHRFQPVVALEDRQVAGYEAIGDEDHSAAGHSGELLLAGVASRLTHRVHQVQRRLAAEESRQLPDAARLFLRVPPADFEDEKLVDSLAGLLEVLPGRSLVVAVPDEAFADPRRCLDFRRRLEPWGIAFAYEGFAGGKTQFEAHEALQLDYVKLAEALVRGIAVRSERQRQLRVLAEAARAMGCEVIATGVECEEESRACREVGCRFAQGNLFGSPLPAAAWSAAGR